MGERYRKAEEKAIVEYYPTAMRAEILMRIPGRTWAQCSSKARKMGIHRTHEAKGDSVREGRKSLKHSWSDEDNNKFDRYYPHSTCSALLNFFYPRTLLSIRTHAQKRHIHRTKEAKARQAQIGREECHKKKHAAKQEVPHE